MIYVGSVNPWKADRIAPSPNHGSRPGPGISLILLHATADRGNEQGSIEWMQNPKSEASCHLLFLRDGSVTRMVDDNRRAWHAGASHWPGVRDVNGESLGWEIANKNDGKEPYTDAQYAKVAKVLAHYLPQGIRQQEVLGHAEVAIPKGRKTDPKGWDWSRMNRELAALSKVVPFPTPKPEPLKLDRIETPTPDHINEIIRVRRLDPDEVAEGIAVAEVLARGVLNADVSRRGEVVKRYADALSDWLRSRLPPAA